MQMKSTRVTRGVQVDEVWAAADAVLSQGERPTIERVRAYLGRGSPNTVAPMLDAWYGSLAKRLDANGGEEGTGEQGALPAPVLRVAKALWGRAQQHAQEQAAQSVQVDRDALEKLVERLAAERTALDQEQQRLNERSEALGAALLAKDHQIADLMRQVTDLQKGLAGRDADIESVRTQHAAATQALQAERGRLNALNEEHRQERERLEQRASAQERRLLEDVDRTRQELKRVTLLLADDNKKAAKSLADSHEQAQSLRVQVSALIAENAGLAREILSAREDLQMAHSHQEQLQKDMADLLVQLKARLPKGGANTETPATRSKMKTVLKR
ncbi:DNA-binding protein [Ottowia sp.]|uniref:DNA-binding protein n=2 Tax=Ottowia sp. TaxID=1898956 RepID=UPI002CAD533A|nr:DNA-binding protein [Ottowia sp.]HRN76394.1 DNA-binding protein [Ottowia sp.]